MSTHESTPPETSELDYEPAELQDEWSDEPDELPRRPRRRLLTPMPLALLAVLLIACGFIGGVLVQKGQGGATATSGRAGGFASRLAALKGATPGAGGGTGAVGASAAAGGANAFAGLAGAGGGVTTGEVTFVRGDTLYVTDSQGNTVKVTAAAGAKVTKTVNTRAQSIHPGTTVVVLGAKAKNGSISANSISVRSAAASGAVPTGAGSSAAGANGSGTSGGGTPTLFGPG